MRHVRKSRCTFDASTLVMIEKLAGTLCPLEDIASILRIDVEELRSDPVVQKSVDRGHALARLKLRRMLMNLASGPADIAKLSAIDRLCNEVAASEKTKGLSGREFTLTIFDNQNSYAGEDSKERGEEEGLP